MKAPMATNKGGKGVRLGRARPLVKEQPYPARNAVWAWAAGLDRPFFTGRSTRTRHVCKTISRLQAFLADTLEVHFGVPDNDDTLGRFLTLNPQRSPG